VQALDLVRDLGAAISRVTERWVPDAWVICMILTVVALGLAILGAGVAPADAALAWGSGLWSLLALSMQFTIAMVAAHACVASRPVYRWLDRLASLPDPARPLQAIALAGLFSIVTAYLNWALCLVACALFVPFVCRRNPRVDVRVLVAASYLGLGTVWHGGLSGSAPLILATPGNPLLAPPSGAPVVDRIFPVTETIFTGFNLMYLLVIAAVGVLVTLALHPRTGAVTLGEDQVRAILPEPPEPPPTAATPAGRLDAFPGFTWLAAGLIGFALVHSIATRGFGASWTIDAYNMVFLAAALLLHGRPSSFLLACRRGMDSAWGIVLQFPFYAGIFGLVTYTGLGSWIASLFAGLASGRSFPFVVYCYSALMNLFVPSGGSKWLIEAPYLVPAGEQLGVSTVTVLFAYAYGDSTTNLIQPFFAIPILAVTRLRFGDVVGYTLLVALACFAVSAVAMWLIPARL
jgi:short-chain fatty acids transporter